LNVTACAMMATVEETGDDGDDVAQLKKMFRGELLLASSNADRSAYEQARKCFNAQVDRHPQIIAQVCGTGDVQRALEFARARRMSVSVSGGRHMLTGLAMAGEVVIDMRLMRRIEVNVDERYAWVDAGCNVRDLDLEAVMYDLAAVGGQFYDTGMAGFTLGGGFGFLTAMHGLSVDNLLAVEMVTADGTVRTVDDESDPELMWAIRGAGWGLGVVLRFKLRLHSIASFAAGRDDEHVHGHGGFLAWALDDDGCGINRATDILQRMFDLVALGELPREATPVFIVADCPWLDGRPVLMLQHAWIGDPNDSQKFLRQFTDICRPDFDMLAAKHWIDLQDIHTPLNPFSHHYYMASRDMTDEVLEPRAASRILNHLAETRPAGAMCLFIATGKASEVDIDSTACCVMRSKLIYITGCIATGKDDESQFHECIQWVKNSLRGVLRDFITDVYYANFSTAELSGELKETKMLNADHHERVMKVKRRVDPDNIFRHAKLK